MTIYNKFLMATKLVQFAGSITYNSQGFAVLPAYTIIYINASMQPIKRSDLKFLKEGTHYADYYQVITDYPLNVDNLPTSLGDYFIYNNNLVYKVISYQNFLPFVQLSVNHAESTIVRDNRMTYNGTVLSIPFPQIDNQYAPLFELIAMVNSCFPFPATITTLWAFQQELQPTFPYCTVTLETVENIDNTNYNSIDINSSTLYTNISKQLVVKFSFYAFDQIQALSLLEQFKLNYVNFNLTSQLFQWIGFVEEHNPVIENLYEDRTIFNADVRMRFSWIVQQTQISTQTIDTVAFTLSVTP